MHPARGLPTRTWLIALAGLLAVSSALATPPYGDPNQPYDRLPGTWETYHVKWAKPLPGGALKVLVIVPYSESREVVELAQRLDIEYTAIMCAGSSVWEKGGADGGDTSSPLTGKDTEIIRELSRKRLDLSRRYDAIVIARVSWKVIPANVRELIAKHVARGTGLVYVSPNGFGAGGGSFRKTSGNDQEFAGLLQTDNDPAVAKRIIDSLPFDVIPVKALGARDEFPKSSGDTPSGATVTTTPICITTSSHGKGRVLALLNYRYFNKLLRSAVDDSPSRVEYDKVTFDYLFALLAQCVRWSAGSDATIIPEISFHGPATSFTAPLDKKLMQYRYDFKNPQRFVARKDLRKSKILLSVSGNRGPSSPLKNGALALGLTYLV